MDGFAQAGSAEDRWDALVSGARERLDRVGRLSAEVEALRVSASDARGAVTVEVNGSGIVSGLRLGPGVEGWPPGRLSGEIMTVMGRAHQALAQRVAEIVSSSVGQDSPSGRAVMSGLQRRLGLDPDAASGSEGAR